MLRWLPSSPVLGPGSCYRQSTRDAAVGRIQLGIPILGQVSPRPVHARTRRREQLSDVRTPRNAYKTRTEVLCVIHPSLALSIRPCHSRRPLHTRAHRIACPCHPSLSTRFAAPYHFKPQTTRPPKVRDDVAPAFGQERGWGGLGSALNAPHSSKTVTVARTGRSDRCRRITASQSYRKAAVHGIPHGTCLPVEKHPTCRRAESAPQDTRTAPPACLCPLLQQTSSDRPLLMPLRYHPAWALLLAALLASAGCANAT